MVTSFQLVKASQSESHHYDATATAPVYAFYSQLDPKIIQDKTFSPFSKSDGLD